MCLADEHGIHAGGAGPAVRAITSWHELHDGQDQFEIRCVHQRVPLLRHGMLPPLGALEWSPGAPAPAPVSAPQFLNQPRPDPRAACNAEPDQNPLKCRPGLLPTFAKKVHCLFPGGCEP